MQLLRSTPVPVPWNRAIRAAVALAVPLAVGYAVDRVGPAALVSTGALPMLLADGPGSYRYRAVQLGGAGFAASAGFALGSLVAGKPWFSVPLIVLVAAVSALISAAASNASMAGLMLLVFGTLGTGQVTFEPGYFVLGAAWSLAVALVGWTWRATGPERRAVAEVYTQLAAMLSVPGEEARRAARHQLTGAMNTAYDRMLTARSWLSGRDRTYRRLLNLLSATTPAVEAAVAMVNAGQRAPRKAIDYLNALSAAVLADQPIPSFHDDSSPLSAGLEKISADAERARRPRDPARVRMRQWAELLASGPLTWLAALQLSLCVLLAELLSLVLPIERSYWITLTVGIVLKPDFGSVFGRAVQRAIGTVVGVGLGAAVLAVGVRGWPLVLLIAVFAAGAAIGKARNYGLMSTFITPLIILQMNLTSHTDWALALARLLDTLAGCAIVLIFGYLLWPGMRRPKVGRRLADEVRFVSEYVEHTLKPVTTQAERLARSRARRRAYRGLADLRTAFQQVMVEPSQAGRQALAWWPMIAALERVADAVTEVVVTVEHGEPPPAEPDVALLTAALGELGAAVEGQRDPVSVRLPVTRQLCGVVDQVAAAFDAVRGP